MPFFAGRDIPKNHCCHVGAARKQPPAIYGMPGPYACSNAKTG